MKKIISVFLSAAMIFSMNISSFAETGAENSELFAESAFAEESSYLPTEMFINNMPVDDFNQSVTAYNVTHCFGSDITVTYNIANSSGVVCSVDKSGLTNGSGVLTVTFTSSAATRTYTLNLTNDTTPYKVINGYSRFGGQIGYAASKNETNLTSYKVYEGIEEGDWIYADRSVLLKSVSDYLKGASVIKFIKNGGNTAVSDTTSDTSYWTNKYPATTNTNWYTHFTLTSPATIVYSAHTIWPAAPSGWTQTNSCGIVTATNFAGGKPYTKHFNAGETVYLPNWGSTASVFDVGGGYWIVWDDLQNTELSSLSYTVGTTTNNVEVNNDGITNIVIPDELSGAITINAIPKVGTATTTTTPAQLSTDDLPMLADLNVTVKGSTKTYKLALMRSETSGFTSSLCTLSPFISDLGEDVTAGELAASISGSTQSVSVTNANGAVIGGNTPIAEGCKLIIDGHTYVISTLIKNSFIDSLGFYSGSQKYDLVFNSTAGNPTFNGGNYSSTGVKKPGDSFYIFNPDLSRSVFNAFIQNIFSDSNTSYSTSSFDFMFTDESEILASNTNWWTAASSPSKGSNSIPNMGSGSYASIEPFELSVKNGLSIPAAANYNSNVDTKISDIVPGRWYHMTIEFYCTDTFDTSGNITSRPTVVIRFNGITSSYVLNMVSPGLRNFRIAPINGTDVCFDNIFNYSALETETNAHPYSGSMYSYASMTPKSTSTYTISSKIIKGIRKNETTIGEVLEQMDFSSNVTSIKAFNDESCTQAAQNSDPVTSSTVFVLGSKGGFNIESLYSYYTPEPKSAMAEVSFNEDWTREDVFYYGYGESLTVAELKAKAVVSPNATMKVCGMDGVTELSDTESVKRGTTLVVTSENEKTVKKIMFADPYCKLLEPICSVSGRNADGTLSSDAKLSASIDIKCFKASPDSKYALILAKYDENKLVDCVSEPFAADAVGTKTLTASLPINSDDNISYKAMVWDYLAGCAPLKRSVSVNDNLAGKKIAFFGDSITGLYDPGYPGYVANILGVDAINCGINGSTWATTNWGQDQYFSVAYRLQALLEDGFDRTAINNYAAQNTSGVTLLHYNNGINLDVSELDAVTMLYGTNDFTYCAPLDNTENKKDTTTIKGAARYSYEILHEKNPDLKIIVFTPFYRDRQNKTTDTVTDKRNSDEYTNTDGMYLGEYVQAIKEVSAEYDYVTCYDMYELMGIDRFDQIDYLYDGLHFSDPVGLKMGATKISDCIVKAFK